MQRPIGPVAVFGEQLPFAFSVLGGDVASALHSRMSGRGKGTVAHPQRLSFPRAAPSMPYDESPLPAGASLPCSRVGAWMSANFFMQSPAIQGDSGARGHCAQDR